MTVGDEKKESTEQKQPEESENFEVEREDTETSKLSSTNRKRLFWWKLGVLPVSTVLAVLLSCLYYGLSHSIHNAIWSKVPMGILVNGADGTVHSLHIANQYQKDLDPKGETHRSLFFKGFKQTIPRLTNMAGDDIELDLVKDSEAKKNRVRFGLQKSHPKHFYFLIERYVPQAATAGVQGASGAETGDVAAFNTSPTGTGTPEKKEQQIPDENVVVPYSPIVWKVVVAQTKKSKKKAGEVIEIFNYDTSKAIREILCVYEWPKETDKKS